jgi:hypothetical protein
MLTRFSLLSSPIFIILPKHPHLHSGGFEQAGNARTAVLFRGHQQALSREFFAVSKSIVTKLIML